MKTLKERVIAQLEAEYPTPYDVQVQLEHMTPEDIIHRISAEVDEMFKEFKAANQINHRFVRDEQY